MTAKGQQPMFESIPSVSPLRTTWVCAKCGGRDPSLIHVDQSRPTVDERYAVGWCDDCCKPRKVRGVLTRDRVQLVDARVWNPQRFATAAARRADAKLLHRYRRGDLLTPDEIAGVKAIMARLEAR